MANMIAVGIWYHLLWIGGFGLALAVAEYRWPAGQQPRFAALAGNILIIVLVMGILGSASMYAGSFYDWLALNGVVGMAFGDWHPRTTTGLIAVTIVYVFVWDFFQYWFHRAEHKFAVLWPVHALHHDEECLNWTTSQRNTLWSALLHFFLVNVPTVIVCGLDLFPIAGAYLFFKIYGPFNHANIRVDLGFLTPLISGPQWHRIHHGRNEEYFNKNFAAFFPVIDIVFGTYRRPLPNEYPATGLSDRPQASLSLKHLLQNVFGIAPDRDAEKAIDPGLKYAPREPIAPVRCSY
jgi:sterol desaturase/sphingolipid hydroxylase (fatty acid hydroxylase superfamily)